MNTEKEAREAMAKSRLHQEHIDENILMRSQAEINQSFNQELESEARELMVEQRHDEKHSAKTMLSRTEEEISPN